MVERIQFKDTILMMDEGILFSEIFLKALDMGFKLNFDSNKSENS